MIKHHGQHNLGGNGSVQFTVPQPSLSQREVSTGTQAWHEHGETRNEAEVMKGHSILTYSSWLAQSPSLYTQGQPAQGWPHPPMGWAFPHQ